MYKRVLSDCLKKGFPDKGVDLWGVERRTEEMKAAIDTSGSLPNLYLSIYEMEM